MTGDIMVFLPSGIVVAVVSSIVVLEMHVISLFISPVSIARLNPEGQVASLGSIDSDWSSRERVFVIYHRITVVEIEVTTLRHVDTAIPVERTWVMVVFTVSWSITCLRIMRRMPFVSLLHITLVVSGIDGEISFGACFLLLGDVAGSQCSVVKWGHAIVSSE